MQRKLYIGLPYHVRMEQEPNRMGGMSVGMLGFQIDNRPHTDGDILEITFRDGRYDPTSIIIHEDEGGE
jgi:hypothetical protein